MLLKFYITLSGNSFLFTLLFSILFSSINYRYSTLLHILATYVQPCIISWNLISRIDIHIKLFTMLTQISFLHLWQNNFQLETVNGLYWYSAHFEQVLGLGIISTWSFFEIFAIYVADSSHNRHAFLIKVIV